MELLELLVNDIENGAGRFAVLELSDKWMGKKIVLCASFVSVQGIIEH
jgi:hypothetical protein